MQLKLHPGPRLLHPCDGADGHREWLDVSASAVEYLFEQVELSPDLTLADVLGLLVACPALQLVYARLDAPRVSQEAQLGPLAQAHGLTRLELRHSWKFDSHQRHYSEVTHLILDGLGPTSSAEQVDGEPLAVPTTRYEVAGSSVRSLLDLPLHFASDLDIYEEDRHANAFMRVLQYAHWSEIRLGEMLHGVLRSLTWLGDPDETGTLAEVLPAIDDNPDAWSEPMSCDDLIQEMLEGSDMRSCAALFESTGAIKPFTIYMASKEIPDDRNALRWLQKRFGLQVKLRPAYARLNGRSFRRAFDKAAEDHPA